jgi:hypothetical protein
MSDRVHGFDHEPARWPERMVVGFFQDGSTGLVRQCAASSYTELEFDPAGELGLPRLVFVLDENAVLPLPLAMGGMVVG